MRSAGRASSVRRAAATARPTQTRFSSGSRLTGGQTRHIGKGEVFVIPAGIPHWFKEVSPTVNYFTVKVLKQN